MNSALIFWSSFSDW